MVKVGVVGLPGDGVFITNRSLVEIVWYTFVPWLVLEITGAA